MSPMLSEESTFQKRMLNFIKRVELAAEPFIPGHLMKQYCDVRDRVCPFPTAVENGITCAVSVAVDHISSLHIDNDFFLTYMTVRSHVDGGVNWNLRDVAPPVYHFVFPTIGYVLVLHPGDVVVFNPKLPHCCAKKLPNYEVPVFLTSFYVKAGHIGGNNNEIPLTPEQLLLLNDTHSK